MRCLVIGGTGFIGSWIVRDLVQRGEIVSMLHRGRRTPDLPESRIRSIVSTASLSTAEPYEAALRPGEPDVVIHVVAMREAEAIAALPVLGGRTGRIVVLSSGDVYRAYGRFMRFEPGPLEPMPLDAARSPLRSRFYPYRSNATQPGAPEYDYDKIPVERAFQAPGAPPSVILRLPKVYGAGNESGLSHTYRFADHPSWRWTHGYVENVAAAIVLAAIHPASSGRVYNIGEAATPTIGERLRHLPPSDNRTATDVPYNFEQDVVYDTQPIRTELGYCEPIPYDETIRRTFADRQNAA
jgi:nucleoside-diphosphate-sugar epimerase